MNNGPIAQRLVRARTQLLLDQPWFGSQAMHLQMRRDDSEPTMAVDGTTLFYNQRFVGTISQSQLVAVIAHEVLHCALGHPWRRNGRDFKTWNVATDYAINQVLTDSGFQLPQGALLDMRYRGWTADAIYAFLRQGPSQGSQGPSQGSQGLPQGLTPTPPLGSPSAAPQSGATGSLPCPTGEVLDAPQKPAPGQMSEADWRVASEQATRVAAKAGKLPLGVEQTVERLVRRSDTDWVAELREYVQRLSPTNYSWTRPNRRSLPNIRTPGIVRDQISTVVIAVDTSGSVSQTMFTTFLAEVQTVLSEVAPQRVVLIQADAAVGTAEEYAPGDEIEWKRCGAGGTRFRPTFEYIGTEGYDPDVLLYLTDLASADTPEDPGYPVLWVTPLWIQREGPFGKTLRLEVPDA